MSYIVDARCVKELFETSRRLERRPVLRILWRLIFPLLVVLCYFGLLVAGPYCELLPFDILKGFGVNPSMWSYWVLAVIIMLVIVSICCYLSLICYRHLRIRCISVEVIVLLIGSIFAAWYASRIVAFGS